MSQPTLKTQRLTLRPFVLSDAVVVQKLAGNKAIADTTLNIPHPYEDGVAEQWIETHQPAYEQGILATFAVVPDIEIDLVGVMGLMRIDREHDKGELGYWIGKEYWNLGYATEAARAVITYGFGQLGLNRIHAFHLGRNKASGRVMQKAGMHLEGTARQDLKRGETYEDMVAYGILRHEWQHQ